MPNYDFRCAGCGHEFTVMVSIGDKDKVACPGCGDKNVVQLFTGCMVNTGGAGDNGYGCDRDCNCACGCDMPATGGCGLNGGCGMQ